MSFAGGLAATRAAVTGAGAGLRDRFPTREQQLERLVYLKAQLRWYEGQGNKPAAEDVRTQMREIEALKHSAG